MGVLILPSFGGHIFEGVSPDYSAPSLHIPPVVDVDGLWNLDFTSLLLFDRVIVDSQSVEFVQHSRLKVHRSLRETIAVLADQGFLEVRDYGEIARRSSDELRSMDEAEAAAKSVWRKAGRGSIGIWKQKALPATDIRSRFSFAIWYYMLQNGGAFTFEEAERLERIALEVGKKEARLRNELHEFASQTYLRQVHLNLILARELAGTVLDWENIQPFYHEKLLRVAGGRDERNQRAKLKELFTMGLPDYQPRNAKEFLRLASDRRLSRLREIITYAAQTGESVDQRFVQSSLRELMDSRERADRLRKRTAWITSPLLLLHLPGHLIREVIVEGLHHAAKTKIEEQYSWPTLIIDSAAVGPQRSSLD